MAIFYIQNPFLYMKHFLTRLPEAHPARSGQQGRLGETNLGAVSFVPAVAAEAGLEVQTLLLRPLGP